MQATFDYVQHIGSDIYAYIPAKVVFAFFFAVITYLFDPLEVHALVAMFILVIADFGTGVSASVYQDVIVSSSKLKRTAVKLAVYFLLAAMGRITEYALPAQIAFLDETIIGYLCATELLSILENTSKMGFSVPGKILKALREYLQSK